MTAGWHRSFTGSASPAARTYFCCPWISRAPWCVCGRRLDSGGDGGASLGSLDDLWQDVQGYMHIIVSHEDLDEAEALMAQAKALSAQGSTEELYPVLAQLRHQFRLIAETQQLSPKNIF